MLLGGKLSGRYAHKRIWALVQNTEQRTWKRNLTKLGLGIFVFLFVFGFVGGIYLSIQATGKLPPRPDRILDAWMVEKGLDNPVSITILRGLNRGHVDLLYQKTWPETSGENTSFPLGELVEPWIAQAVLVLYDQEKIDLDVPVRTYLPQLPESEGMASVASYLDYTALLQDAVTAKETFKRTKKHYRMLSQLIEAVAEMPSQTFIKQTVIDPLEMADTEFRVATDDPIINVGSWYTTASDFTRWARVLNSNRLVKMRTQLRAQTPTTLENGDRWLYGFGWRFEPWNGYRMVEASSFGSDSSYAILRLPQKNFTILILSQEPRAGFDPLSSGREIARIYLEREFPENYRFANQENQVSTSGD